MLKKENSYSKKDLSVSQTKKHEVIKMDIYPAMKYCETLMTHFSILSDSKTIHQTVIIPYKLPKPPNFSIKLLLSFSFLRSTHAHLRVYVHFCPDTCIASNPILRPMLESLNLIIFLQCSQESSMEV